MSLYERLGASEIIRNIINDVVDNHLVNPAVTPRFQNMKSTPEELKVSAGDFFIVGTGGPGNYLGKDMLATHKWMNVSANEFMAELDDILAALNKNEVGQREQEEVLYILSTFRLGLSLEWLLNYLSYLSAD